jgi:hypothetical protein
LKQLETLKQDLEHVILTGEGYTKEIAEWVGDLIEQATYRQLSNRQSSNTTSTLRMSSLGTPCDRKLWYSTRPWLYRPEEMLASTLNKFIFGDIVEAWTLGIVKASGHKLEGLQDRMQINGIYGSRDCIIDGMTFDIKSASTYGFEKFKNNGLLEDDPFSYLSQLSSYVYAAKDDPLVTNKNHGGFIAIDKQMGHVAVDIYDLSVYLDNRLEEVKHKKAIVNSEKLPERKYTDELDGKSGNRKLNTMCSYCPYKFHCWPEVRTYIYSTGPRYLTVVEREPKVFEVKNA